MNEYLRIILLGMFGGMFVSIVYYMVQTWIDQTPLRIARRTRRKQAREYMGLGSDKERQAYLEEFTARRLDERSKVDKRS